jgi:hypothetical protein
LMALQTTLGIALTVWFTVSGQNNKSTLGFVPTK